VRKYEPDELSESDLAGAGGAAAVSPVCTYEPSWRMNVLLSPAQRDPLLKAGMAGLRAKVNAWLGVQHIPAMVCVTANPDDAPSKADRYFYLLESAIAFEAFAARGP